MKHTCKRCGYETDYVGNLKNHLNKQKTCRDILLCGISASELFNQLKKNTTSFSYECTNCSKKYKSPSGLYFHKKSCEITRLSNEIDILKRSIACSPDLAYPHGNNIQIVNNIQNNTNNINIVINALGHENTSYITHEFMLDCIKKKVDGLVQYLTKKHFDPDHPENHNIKIEGDNYVILENPLLSRSHAVVERTPTEKGDFWIKLRKLYALHDNIMPRVETEFKKFFQEYPIENIQQKYIEEFVKDIVLPMDWSMELDDYEDALENPDDTNIKKIIYAKIKETIDESYSKHMLTKSN